MSDIQEFDFSVNLMKAILWQHENAPNLLSLVRSKQEWYNENQRDFWLNWYRDVFDLDTANDFGLSVWSRILNLPLEVEVNDTRAKPAFGFGSNHKNFGNGNFARFSGAQSLTTAQKRIALKLRYFQLTSNGTVPDINEWLHALFGDQGRAFVVDSLDMNYITYFFNFQPDSQTRYILENFDLLPRPAGVGVKWQTQIKPSFGFGDNHLNFENGNFGG